MASIVLLLIVFLFQGSSDIYASSMPQMQKYFSTSINGIQTTITLFLISYGIGQFLWVYLSEKYDRKNIIILNLMLFTISSLLVIFSNNLNTLYELRALQGISISALNLNVKAIPLEIFNDRNKIKFFYTYFAIFWGAGGTLSPWLGSYIQHHYDWKANFGVLAIYSLIITSLALTFIPKRITKKSMSLSILLKDFYLVGKNLGFLSGVFAQACTLSMFLSFNYFMSFYMQQQIKLSVLYFGYISLLIGVSFILGGLAFRYFSNYYLSNQICLTASILAIILIIAYLCWYLLISTSFIIMMIFLCFIIFLSGFMASENIGITMLYFKNKASVASCIHTALHFVLAAGLMMILSFIQYVGILSFLGFYIGIIALFIFLNSYCYSKMKIE